MSEFSITLTGRVDIKRATPDLLDKSVVAASMSATRQPAQAVRLAIEVDGCVVGTGLVSIAGSTTDAISFSANGTIVNQKDFTSISGITVAGISGGFITIRAVTRTGQPVIQEAAVHNSLPVRFYPLSGRIRMLAAGQTNVAKYKFMADPDKVIKNNDFMYAISGIPGITHGQVSFVEEVMDFDGLTHHVEAEVIPL